ncbi:MAG: thioether cross-link-forming SCIFF peptide maturase [Tissierellia bacterium]|nr:thioether cross-link-forming SCIFF peptide maturase [Tissierellia bacterium]
MIHQYKLGGYNIVLDINSGSVHSVDELAYDVVAMYKDQDKEMIIDTLLEKYGDNDDVNREDIEELLEDLAYLEKEGRLFSEDIVSTSLIDFAKKDVVKALCLHVAHTCNLNCDYCFASQGNYKGDRALMSPEVGKRALDFLVENSGSIRNLEVDFFGGEPLMNWEVVKELVAYGRELEKVHGKNFRFTLTTNGMLVDDEVIEFSNKEMHNVVMSLDGRKPIHDSLRKTVNGRGSYDTIVPKFQDFAEKRGDREYYVRGTYTHQNVDFTEDILHMADLGFTELSMEPVVCDPADPYALTEEDLPILFDQYEILAKEMISRKKEGRGFNFYHYMIDLAKGPCLQKRMAGCGAGTEYLAVTPWGDLYPCHQFVGDEAFLMGSVFDGIKNKRLREDFKTTNTYSRSECRDCWAKFYCAGGCFANSHHAGGSIKDIYEYGCKLFKKRMECAIMIKVAEAELSF